MEDNLNINKMEDDLNFSKMEDDLNFIKRVKRSAETYLSSLRFLFNDYCLKPPRAVTTLESDKTTPHRYSMLR